MQRLEGQKEVSHLCCRTQSDACPVVTAHGEFCVIFVMLKESNYLVTMSELVDFQTSRV